ncbi:Aryl-phospho-beta-D-glucosidase BglC, GH1 family [Granulicella rosea]|uniref:Aryl-phospho-beta-D-glucosidase BglC, GH1 family n=1 Tax=Granulicella rosea TaxID=474952 RepID=A0A239H6S7_9BACT|nr:cellulase family glycosylhydrolase [Granulicella rosea]SNS75984.1 Aryl-phospho-beta-D-glucosidase BglC, GH1 family [Granulicella rosea]
MRNWKRYCLAWILVLLAGVSAASAQVGNSLAFQRAQHLRRGINLSMWYAQSGDYSDQRIASFTNAEDFKLIKSLGFDHVRLSINPEPLIAEQASSALRPEAIARLDKSVDEIQAAGLAVVLDIHPEYNWKDQLKQGDDPVARFYAFWMVFAGHYSTTDPDKIFFEILNEPVMDDIYRWQGIQARTVMFIRRVAPKHTIIATAAQWGNIDGLLAGEPVRDENVIYSFHEYQPMWFTHQGANWSTQSFVSLHGVPYPSTAENVNAMKFEEADERTRLFLERYGLERWDAKRLGAEVAAVAEWAQRRGVPLYCGEFGVYKNFSDPQMRATWISDVRTALESKKIGWAMWDYQTSFGLVTKKDGVTTVDPAVVAALGLKR